MASRTPQDIQNLRRAKADLVEKARRQITETKKVEGRAKWENDWDGLYRQPNFFEWRIYDDSSSLAAKEALFNVVIWMRCDIFWLDVSSYTVFRFFVFAHRGNCAGVNLRGVYDQPKGRRQSTTQVPCFAGSGECAFSGDAFFTVGGETG